MLPQPILHLEWLSPFEVFDVNLLTTIEILGMNSLSPSASHLLRQGASTKFEPWSAEPGALCINAGQPDQHGGVIRNLLKQASLIGQRCDLPGKRAPGTSQLFVHRKRPLTVDLELNMDNPFNLGRICPYPTTHLSLGIPLDAALAFPTSSKDLHYHLVDK